MSTPSHDSPLTFGARVRRLIPANAYVRSALFGIVGVLLFAGIGTTYAYVSTPPEIRSPHYEHLHFRMQIINDGKAVNFASKAFQEGYSKDNCNADLTKSPIHFHDGKDQFVHIHWQQLSGGDVLKYYGWNYTGGTDGLMGYRFDQFPNLQTVPVHGAALPKVSDTHRFYVYVGDEHGYKKRSFDDFVNKDLEAFFGKHSNVPQDDQVSLLDRLFPTAYAHGDEHHDELLSADSVPTDEELKQLNNLIGNVVLFVQSKEPSAEQVKARFADLEPLSTSTCAG